MLVHIDIAHKTIGAKELFSNLQLTIQPGQKVGIIGRNGVGKSTLFSMLSGQDTDFEGSIQFKRGIKTVSTRQEHHAYEHTSVMNYMLDALPEYRELHTILETYPETMGTNIKKIQTYTESLERFSMLDYYTIEEVLKRELEAFGVSKQAVSGRMAELSGGQKRFVDLVLVEHSLADVALIDEPTNHMDYAGKAAFIEWLKHTQMTVLVITHDRDVLAAVDNIVEIKDRKAYEFTGNYSAYIAQNTVQTTTKLNDYNVAIKTLDNLHKKIMWARARKPSWHGTADQRNPFEVMERRLQKEYDAVKAANPKPSFWIDRESAESLKKNVAADYQKFKAETIQITKATAVERANQLITMHDVSLGYTAEALFQPLSASLEPGERLRLVGRNGAGKTTLVKALIAASSSEPINTLISGTIQCGKKLKLGIYEQELPASELDMPLATAVEQIYREAQLPITDQLVKQVLGDYLFDPQHDGGLQVSMLSGGQKARLQLIRMLAGKPNVLILDEPTNHLDLPSIEELEDALKRYEGAVIYVTHDSYFARTLAGRELALLPSS